MCIQGTSEPQPRLNWAFASVSSTCWPPHPASSQGPGSPLSSCQFHSALASLDPACPPDLRRRLPAAGLFSYDRTFLLSLPFPPLTSASAWCGSWTLEGRPQPAQMLGPCSKWVDSASNHSVPGWSPQL